jgi:hypothetical protein
MITKKPVSEYVDDWKAYAAHLEGLANNWAKRANNAANELSEMKASCVGCPACNTGGVPYGDAERL